MKTFVQLLITLLLFLSYFSEISKAQENTTQNESVETGSDSVSSDEIVEIEKF